MSGQSLDLPRYVRQQPVMLALLAGLAVLLFVAVGGLSRAYHAQRESLGDRWFNRGVADLNARHFDSAVKEFRAALLYSRDDYSYQLNLAEALLGLRRTSEASAYLDNLWERQPENGLVNLELARVAAQQEQTDQALRYYHNAIYAAWPGDQEIRRRDARVELIEYLLRINRRAEAESEVIALEANQEDDPAQQAQVGDFFVRTLDYERALAAYRQSLKLDRNNAAALAGAGLAAFELGRYPLAQRYLQDAVAANSGDTQSADRLRTTELVLQLDPFQRQISVAQRNRIVVEAFESAGQRLKACGIPQSAAAGSHPSLADSWEKLKPRITEAGLRQEPDLVETAMELVFGIERQTERQTSAACGPPVGTDMALLLIAGLHEGN